MLKVKVEDVDELHRLFGELCIYIYFQGLLQEDREEDILGEEQMRFIQRSAENYLWSRQRETVLKIKALVESEVFTCSENAPCP